MDRGQILRSGLDFAQLTGLEIGALNNPIVRKSEGRILYVDHTSTEALIAQYAADPNIDKDSIVPVDRVWGKQTLSECLDGELVDYVFASQVGEHVPDLITWLQEIREVLKPGGELRLALPDKRFGFDYLRDESRLSDLLAAYLLRSRRPQVRDVLDFRLHYAPGIDYWGLFQGTYDPAQARPEHSFAVAMDSARWVRDDPDLYSDVHVWVFQPKTFAGLMRQLAECGLLRMACATFLDRTTPPLEFYVFMQPCDDQEAIVASWREAHARLLDPPLGSAAERRLREEANALAEAKRKIEVLEQQVRDLSVFQERARALENSTSWRMTAPLRTIKAHLSARGRSRIG